MTIVLSESKDQEVRLASDLTLQKKKTQKEVKKQEANTPGSTPKESGGFMSYARKVQNKIDK